MIWRTPRCRWSSLAAAPPLLVAGVLAAALLGCTSIDGPTEDVDTWKESWKGRAVAVKDGAAAGAVAVGDSIGTAYTGIRDGFEDPEADAFGPAPKRYAERIRKHMIRFEDVPRDASFQFGAPERGYMNAGILAGGKVEWQGWLVDVEVETTTFAGQKRSKAYVVRMTQGEVEEVHDAQYTHALRRLEPRTERPASAAK
ncbi:MAG: hypothetical protein ACQGVC_03390 [Myxococcota bacterium]